MNDPTPGSRVALCAANSLEYLISVLAVLEAGKILVPLSCESTTDQLHQLLNDTHPTVIIVDDKGDRLIHSDHELKINFSQFECLVRTYQIGRASCSERVCLYLYISVVAVLYINNISIFYLF